MESIEEIRTYLNQLIEPPEGGGSIDTDIQRRLRLAAMPDYVSGLADLKEGLAKLKYHLEPCPTDECVNGMCPGREPHFAHFKIHLEGPILRMEKELDELYEAAIKVIHELMNCECPNCQTGRQQQNAPFN